MFLVDIKVLRDRLRYKEVVVQVEEALTQTSDTVQVQLDRVRVERRQVALVLEDLGVCDDVHTRVCRVQPDGDLSVGDDVEVVDPRCVLEKRTQRELEHAVVSKAFHGNLIQLLKIVK